jgi:hypothetical protein
MSQLFHNIFPTLIITGDPLEIGGRVLGVRRRVRNGLWRKSEKVLRTARRSRVLAERFARRHATREEESRRDPRHVVLWFERARLSRGKDRFPPFAPERGTALG